MEKESSKSDTLKDEPYVDASQPESSESICKAENGCTVDQIEERKCLTCFSRFYVALKMFCSNHRELLVIVCLCAVWFMSNISILRSKEIRYQQFEPLFSESDRLVSDYANGGLDFLQPLNRSRAHTLLMLYAPWDAESAQAKPVFSAIALLNPQLECIAVACWNVSSDCWQRFRTSRFPTFALLLPGLKELVYAGPIDVSHVHKFLTEAPIGYRTVASDAEIKRYAQLYDNIVLGCFNLSSASSPLVPGLHQFYAASVQMYDMFAPLPFYLPVYANSELFHCDHHGQIILLRSSLPALTPDIARPLTASELSAWLRRNIQPATLAVLNSPGVKSRRLFDLATTVGAAASSSPTPYRRRLLMLALDRQPRHWESPLASLLSQLDAVYARGCRREAADDEANEEGGEETEADAEAGTTDDNDDDDFESALAAVATRAAAERRRLAEAASVQRVCDDLANGCYDDNNNNNKKKERYDSDKGNSCHGNAYSADSGCHGNAYNAASGCHGNAACSDNAAQRCRNNCSARCGHQRRTTTGPSARECPGGLLGCYHGDGNLCQDNGRRHYLTAWQRLYGQRPALNDTGPWPGSVGQLLSERLHQMCVLHGGGGRSGRSPPQPPPPLPTSLLRQLRRRGCRSRRNGTAVSMALLSAGRHPGLLRGLLPSTTTDDDELLLDLPPGCPALVVIADLTEGFVARRLTMSCHQGRRRGLDLAGLAQFLLDYHRDPFQQQQGGEEYAKKQPPESRNQRWQQEEQSDKHTRQQEEHPDKHTRQQEHPDKHTRQSTKANSSFHFNLPTRLSPANLPAFALNSTRDRLVLFHSPACAYCAPLVALATRLARYRLLPIGTVDVTTGLGYLDARWSPGRVPALLLFPRGTSVDPVAYAGPATLPSLLEFLLRHASPSFGLLALSSLVMMNNVHRHAMAAGIEARLTGHLAGLQARLNRALEVADFAAHSTAKWRWTAASGVKTSWIALASADYGSWRVAEKQASGAVATAKLFDRLRVRCLALVGDYARAANRTRLLLERFAVVAKPHGFEEEEKDDGDGLL